MKITATLLMLLVLFLTNSYPQDYTQSNLPEGAVARLGKGKIKAIQYSPDGTRLAVCGSLGIWLYDTTTYRFVALLAGYTGRVYRVVFSPDSRTLAGEGWYENKAVLLWDAETGES